MQKTCQCSRREFYGLGRYDRKTHQFELLDNTSDLGNNAWDGGEGYAHMNVWDPRATPDHPHGRMLWTGAVIEGDRDAAGDAFHSLSPGSPLVLLVHPGRSRYRPWGASLRSTIVPSVC